MKTISCEFHAFVSIAESLDAHNKIMEEQNTILSEQNKILTQILQKM